jgi:hypothetical protein
MKLFTSLLFAGAPLVRCDTTVLTEVIGDAAHSTSCVYPDPSNICADLGGELSGQYDHSDPEWATECVLSVACTFRSSSGDSIGLLMSPLLIAVCSLAAVKYLRDNQGQNSTSYGCCGCYKGQKSTKHGDGQQQQHHSQADPLLAPPPLPVGRPPQSAPNAFCRFCGAAWSAGEGCSQGCTADDGDA